jgi:hypothetical protein
MEYVGSPNKPKAEVHTGAIILTGPRIEEEEGEEEEEEDSVIVLL